MSKLREYKSVAPVANCISDLQTRFQFSGEQRANMARKRESVSTRHGEHFIDLSIIR